MLPKFVTEVHELYGISVNSETVRRIIRSSGYYARVAWKKLYISEKNRKVPEKSFSKSMKHKIFDNWENVLLLNDSKFYIFGLDGRVLVWSKPKIEYRKQSILPIVKHGKG